MANPLNLFAAHCLGESCSLFGDQNSWNLLQFSLLEPLREFMVPSCPPPPVFLLYTPDNIEQNWTAPFWTSQNITLLQLRHQGGQTTVFFLACRLFSFRVWVCSCIFNMFLSYFGISFILHYFPQSTIILLISLDVSVRSWDLFACNSTMMMFQNVDVMLLHFWLIFCCTHFFQENPFILDSPTTFPTFVGPFFLAVDSKVSPFFCIFTQVFSLPVFMLHKFHGIFSLSLMYCMIYEKVHYALKNFLTTVRFCKMPLPFQMIPVSSCIFGSYTIFCQTTTTTTNTTRRGRKTNRKIMGIRRQRSKSQRSYEN